MLDTKPKPSEDAPEAVSPHRLISVADVRKLFGDVSNMTIWRWLKDAELRFPKPIYVQRRRFWREADLLDWIDKQPNKLSEK